MNLDQRSINNCVRCGTCRSVCPVFEVEGWESANTRGRIMIMKRLMNGDNATSEVIKSLNTCTTCGICIEKCPAGVNPTKLVEATRRELVSLGQMTETQSRLHRNVLATGNTFGKRLDRLAWLRDRRLLLRKKADNIYFAGCMASFRYPEIAAKTFEILGQFDTAVLKAEQCCGSPLIRMGFDASRLIGNNLDEIEKMGANSIITGCAGCYTTLKNNYRSGIDIISVTEFLADHISEIDLKRLDLTVTYHDPCHLGRMNRVYEEPRQVIEAICYLKEMKNNRIDSRCCGGGGGVRAGYKDLSMKMAKKRLEEVPQGVDCVVTSCPLCIRNLSDASNEIRIMDIVELVAMATV